MCVCVCVGVRPALTVTVCSSHVVLLGERDGVLHVDCQDEGGQETVGLSDEGLAGCHEQVHVAQSSLSDLWLVPHRTGDFLILYHSCTMQDIVLELSGSIYM